MASKAQKAKEAHANLELRRAAFIAASRALLAVIGTEEMTFTGGNKHRSFGAVLRAQNAEAEFMRSVEQVTELAANG